MNNDVEPNFKEKFVEICTCRSCKQCMKSIEKTQTQIFFPFHRNPNPTLGVVWFRQNQHSILNSQNLWASLQLNLFDFVLITQLSSFKTQKTEFGG